MVGVQQLFLWELFVFLFGSSFLQKSKMILHFAGTVIWSWPSVVTLRSSTPSQGHDLGSRSCKSRAVRSAKSFSIFARSSFLKRTSLGRKVNFFFFANDWSLNHLKLYYHWRHKALNATYPFLKILESSWEPQTNLYFFIYIWYWCLLYKEKCNFFLIYDRQRGEKSILCFFVLI